MNETIIKKIDSIALYTVLYSITFILLKIIIPYTIPFIIGIIIALLARPIINIITKKIKINQKLVSIVIVIIIFLIIISLISLAIGKIVSELISFSTLLPKTINFFKSDINEVLNILLSYYENFKPTILDNLKSSSNKILPSSFAAVSAIFGYAFGIIKSLPEIIMIILFSLLSSIYISIDYDKIKQNIYSLFSTDNSSKFKNIVFQTNNMLVNYITAYLKLISITFLETLTGTLVLGVKYALLISIVTSISDLLPILGPGTILLPTAIFFIISGLYIKGIGILVLYLIITIVRQIMEPKIVSSSLGIHPLAIIISIFIGLKVYGILGMFFCMFYVVFYVILKRVGLLNVE